MAKKKLKPFVPANGRQKPYGYQSKDFPDPYPDTPGPKWYVQTWTDLNTNVVKIKLEHYIDVCAEGLYAQISFDQAMIVDIPEQEFQALCWVQFNEYFQKNHGIDVPPTLFV